MKKFIDSGPLLLIGGIMIATLPIMVVVGMVARCLWDGLVYGWSWTERTAEGA